MRALAIAVLLMAAIASACQANGAVVLELPFGELYCQDDWDQSEVDERREAVSDVADFAPGRRCADLGFTRHCAGDPDTVLFLPTHEC